MIVTILGSGTSHGIPMLGCSCPVCKSKNIKDKRYRASVLLEKKGKRLVIDTGYEFRLQLLRENISSLEGALYTHSHLDHIAGLDDLRVFSKDKKFPIYASENVIEYISKHFSYAVEDSEYPGVPKLETNILKPYEKVNIQGFEVIPLIIEHGRKSRMKIYGYKIDNFAYITDCTYISSLSFSYLENIDTLVIGALQSLSHGAHFSFEEAYNAAKKMKAKNIYFTHINHKTSYDEIESLYSDAKSAYDGLKLEVRS